jgi:hypothetical protein
LAQLDQDEPGWRLEDIEAARAVISEVENSARCVVAARKLLPKDWPSKESYGTFRDLVPNEQLSAELSNSLSQELDALHPAVLEARKLAERPRGRHYIIYDRNVMQTKLNDQDGTRVITHLLGYDAMRHAQAGNMKEALTSCRAAFNAARSIGDEPLAVTQMVRLACVNLMCLTTERVLAQGEPGEADLVTLQRLLEEEDRHPKWRTILRGERAFFHSLLDAVARGDVEEKYLKRFVAEKGMALKWPELLLDWHSPADLPREHRVMLVLLTRRLQAAQLAPHEQYSADEEFTRGLFIKQMAPYTFPGAWVSYLRQVMRSRANSHVYSRCMAALLAVEHYRLTHNKWPEQLADLVPKFLTSIPLDVYDGQPLRYRRLSDGVVVYSIGPDRTDNGGILNRGQTGTSDGDLGYRLWDVSQRRIPSNPPAHAPGPPGNHR